MDALITLTAVDSGQLDPEFEDKGDGEGPTRKLGIKIKMGTREHETTMVQTLPLSQPSVVA